MGARWRLDLVAAEEKTERTVAARPMRIAEAVKENHTTEGSVGIWGEKEWDEREKEREKERERERGTR